MFSLNYLSWYLSLNSSSFFESTIKSLDKTSLLGIYNNPVKRFINGYYFIDKINNKIVTKSSMDIINKPEQSCLFIGPHITLENIDINLPKCMTIFYLSNAECKKETILERWYSKLGLYPSEENYFLLNEKISQEILIMIFNRSNIILKYTKKEVISYLTLFGMYSCLIVIFICMTSILFLICGIYSTFNPIITEVELERFKIIKYRDLQVVKEESCLICFEDYIDNDDIRILFCNHYFHKKCVDRWLCEQSSRCPYCRYTNKYYDEI